MQILHFLLAGPSLMHFFDKKYPVPQSSVWFEMNGVISLSTIKWLHPKKLLEKDPGIRTIAADTCATHMFHTRKFDRRTAFRMVKSLQEPSWYTFLFVSETNHWTGDLSTSINDIKASIRLRKKWRGVAHRFTVSEATMVVAWLLGVRSGLCLVETMALCIIVLKFQSMFQHVSTAVFPPGQSLVNQLWQSANTSALSPRLDSQEVSIRFSPSVSISVYDSISTSVRIYPHLSTSIQFYPHVSTTSTDRWLSATWTLQPPLLRWTLRAWETWRIRTCPFRPFRCFGASVLRWPGISAISTWMSFQRCLVGLVGLVGWWWLQ